MSKQLVMTFPVAVKQIGSHAITIDVVEHPESFFNEDFVKQVHEAMGVNRGNAVLDEIAMDCSRNLIFDAIRCATVPEGNVKNHEPSKLYQEYQELRATKE